MSEQEVFAEKMLAFKKAFGELSEAWMNLDVKDSEKVDRRYPFKASFDELYYDVVDWVDTYLAPKKKYLIGVYEVWEQMHEVEATSFEEACDLIGEQKSNILDDQFAFVELHDNPYRLYEEE
jgi:hypothetical protein